MLEVTVRYNLGDEKKVSRLDGIAEYYPVVGKPFVVAYLDNGAKVYIDFGKVFNVKAYQNLLLVQTDLAVAEVWIMSGNLQDWANVLPFAPPITSPIPKGGISGSRRRRASSRPSGLIKLNILN